MRRRLPAFAFLAVTTVYAGACAEAGRERAAQVRTTVDTSGGVVVTRNTGAAPILSPQRVLELGSRGGLQESSQDEFGRVMRVLANARGELFVGDGLARQIRVFDSAGTFLRSLGRRGGGPGEIETLRDIAWVADSLLVMDPQNARLTYLTPSGEYIAQWPWMRASGSVVHFYLAGLAVYSFNIDPGGAGERSSTVWVRYTPEGPADTLPIAWRELSPEDRPSGLLCRGGGGIGFFTNPYGRSLLAMPAPGETAARAWNTEYRIVFTSPTGDTVRVVEREAAPIPLDDERRAAVEEDLEAFRADWRGADCEGGVDQPEHLPVVRELGFTHDGRLIVEVNTATGPALDLYDRDFRWTAQIPLPPRDESVPLFLRDDRLYMVARDSLDVQRVEVYRLDGER